jgi:hypothetical protein
VKTITDEGKSALMLAAEGGHDETRSAHNLWVRIFRPVLTKNSDSGERIVRATKSSFQYGALLAAHHTLT